MKLNDLLEGGKGSGRENSLVRPNKNLWFTKQQNWVADISNQSNFQFQYFYDMTNKIIYAMNYNKTKCYGFWNQVKNIGISFKIPRKPQNIIAHYSDLKLIAGNKIKPRNID